MPLDIASLWDFNNPELSEQRFLAALPGASPDEALILKTQVARSYGLRGEFARARELLAEIEPLMSSASPEARVRYYLELGRSYCSATHPPESQTTDARERARSAYMQASELAKAASLDDLAIDALHMLPFVDTAPAEQLDWNLKALGLAEASQQPAARKWEGSLRNNIGYTLYLLGRYSEALTEFERALAVREREGTAEQIRVARWMIAWTLRALGRLDEALQMQLRLEKECDAAGEPDPYVFEELELLYRALGNEQQAEHYAGLRK